MDRLRANRGKRIRIDAAGRRWARYPIRTPVVTAGDDLTRVVREHAGPHLRPGDAVFLGEKMVAVTQGRSFPIDEIEASRLARALVRFVHRSRYGIGIGSPWTMELAIREAGRARILCAAAASALTKPMGIHGVFYLVAGRRVAAIDGPVPYALPPFDRCATLAPARPDEVARALRDAIGHEVVIVDANDLGVEVLGASSRALAAVAREIFRDNPLGQGRQRTPIGIVRAVGPHPVGRGALTRKRPPTTEPLGDRADACPRPQVSSSAATVPVVSARTTKSNANPR